MYIGNKKSVEGKLMKYNIGDVYLMKKNYSKLVKNEEVEIIDRNKKGRYVYLDVRNAKGEVFKGVSFKLLKKKK